MIQSMTAFARTQNQGEWGSAVCEMRSINHRYLDVSLSLPESWRALEMPMREKIRQFIQRGKVDCHFRYQQNLSTTASVNINLPLAQQFCRAHEVIADLLKNPAPVSTADVLRWPGILEVKEVDLSELQTQLFDLLEKALQELVLARKREGEELKKLFLQRLELMEQELNKVRGRIPQILHEQRERLTKRFQEITLELNHERLEQEMVLFIQKMDVTEEIERTETHIQEMKRILKQGGLIGRRLDFLLQELNREANTLGSKSTDTEVTHAAVEMKVLIEQIREQVQNVE